MKMMNGYTIRGVFVTFALVTSLEAGVEVGQWDRFEASVTNTKKYADPYYDVTLDLIWTRPDGSIVSFFGFYDGGATWKFRFMPDQLGTWSYQATFSDGSAGGSGTFKCIVSDIPGQLGKSEVNPMWFGFKGGRHLLVRAFHVGDRFFASNWDDPADPNDGERRKSFLDWTQQQGYNLLSIASHYLNRPVAGRGLGRDTPKLWDKKNGRPKAEEYGEMELILDELKRRRMLVYPFSGFIGKATDYPETEIDQERYIRYTMARLSSYWNILYAVASPEPNVGDDWLPPETVVRLGKTVQRYNVSGHLVSVHNATPDTFEGNIYKDADWTDYLITQGPKTFDLAHLSKIHLRNLHLRKPLLAQETLWPGNGAHPPYDEVNIRKNAYVLTMSGAAICFGDMNGNSSTGFSGTMALSDRNQSWHDAIKTVWDFFEGLPFYLMKPRQDLLSGSEAYALAQEGRKYLVYLPSRGTVNVSVPAGTYEIIWINAQNTSERILAGRTNTGRDLKSPPHGDDWLLYMHRLQGE
ncbi:MAG: DUF5060 domain-containing protein [Acidobacteriota bacterium]